MDIEKIASGLIGGAVTGFIAIGTALVSKGKHEAKFEQVLDSIIALKNELTGIEKDIATKVSLDRFEKDIPTKVSLDRFEKEIGEIHQRMSRTQREQAAAIEKLDVKVDALSGKIEFMSGVMSQLPAKIDAIAERLAKVDR